MFNIAVTSKADACTDTRCREQDSKQGVQQHLSQGLVSLKYAWGDIHLQHLCDACSAI